ncbi:MAG: efflux RND transporter permease subunit, partial [Anaerolineales bacterium]|nr:efflux RND transporter permease subunit [Anaerolineales bacterium]
MEKFLGGQLSIILIVAALVLGASAILLTPREEEPQIVVPLADIYVQFPGASAEEVEKLVATPLERLLWQIDGVEHVYSMSRRDMAVVTVRFYVGEDRERSLVKLHNKVSSHQGEAPPGVTGWVIKPIEIDDVPIVTLTLFSKRYDDHVLRRVAEEVRARLDAVEDISRTRLVGGREKEVRVELLPEEMLARGISALEVHRALAVADASLTAGGFDRDNRRIEVVSGPFIESASDVKNLVVGVHQGRPVYVRDVARVSAGPEQARHYTRIGLGPAGKGEADGRTYPAVTLAVAKKRGTNAVQVANAVLEKIEELKREVIPSDVNILVTRNYGVSADEKVNDLLSSLAFAMITVVGLLIFTLGWREGLVVALAVPISFSLALFVNYIFGYTINRVTLFALLLTLGLVVDDPITNVENIQRHILMRKRSPFLATLWAVKEVLPPVIMSTLTIIVSFLPMFFITGMMGPYMEPMAINVPLTVMFSTLAALTIVPWAAYHLLKKKGSNAQDASNPKQQTAATAPWHKQLYANLVGPFLRSRARRLGLIGLVTLLLAGSGLLVVLRKVPMKMLPFDNKNELQLVLNMPEGTTLEATDAAVRDFERYLFTVPEVTDFESYVGTYSPIDFNGLVRHYYFRTAPHMADIRVNLAPKKRRSAQSHEIALRIRRSLEKIAEQYGAKLAIVESPPGPPVIATLVAEVYGPADGRYEELIAASETIMARMAEEPGVVDIDHSAETPHTRIQFFLDKEKAGLHGIDTETVVRTLRLALAGARPATVHQDGERTPLAIRLQFPRSQRSGIPELGRITLKGTRGELVPLDELGTFREVDKDQPIFHKNLERVVYVFGDTAGRAPGEAILDLGAHFKKHPLPNGIHVEWAGEGEWEITIRVFRDLGLAFGAAMIGIYILLIIQTGSFLMPLVIMTAIPLTAIGIMPGFWLLNVLVDRPIGGFDNPVFFTATAMIGMIALGGIVVRNSIVLIEFIQDSLKEGRPLKEAILESGAVRMRPILLTAATTALGAWPITLDPIFSGLAWALIFGLVASTAFTLVVVPVMYFMIYGR